MKRSVLKEAIKVKSKIKAPKVRKPNEKKKIFEDLFLFGEVIVKVD